MKNFVNLIACSPVIAIISLRFNLDYSIFSSHFAMRFACCRKHTIASSNQLSLLIHFAGSNNDRRSLSGCAAITAHTQHTSGKRSCFEDTFLLFIIVFTTVYCSIFFIATWNSENEIAWVCGKNPCSLHWLGVFTDIKLECYQRLMWTVYEWVPNNMTDACNLIKTNYVRRLICLCCGCDGNFANNNETVNSFGRFAVVVSFVFGLEVHWLRYYSLFYTLCVCVMKWSGWVLIKTARHSLSIDQCESMIADCGIWDNEIPLFCCCCCLGTITRDLMQSNVFYDVNHVYWLDPPHRIRMCRVLFRNRDRGKHFVLRGSEFASIICQVSMKRRYSRSDKLKWMDWMQFYPSRIGLTIDSTSNIALLTCKIDKIYRLHRGIVPQENVLTKCSRCHCTHNR